MGQNEAVNELPVDVMRWCLIVGEMFLLTTNKKIWNKETVRYLVTGRKKLPVLLDEGDPGALRPNGEPAVSDERAPLSGPFYSVACKNWENVLGGAVKSIVHHHILLPQASGCSETPDNTEQRHRGEVMWTKVTFSEDSTHAFQLLDII